MTDVAAIAEFWGVWIEKTRIWTLFSYVIFFINKKSLFTSTSSNTFTGSGVRRANEWSRMVVLVSEVATMCWWLRREKWQCFSSENLWLCKGKATHSGCWRWSKIVSCDDVLRGSFVRKDVQSLNENRWKLLRNFKINRFDSWFNQNICFFLPFFLFTTIPYQKYFLIKFYFSFFIPFASQSNQLCSSTNITQYFRRSNRNS